MYEPCSNSIYKEEKLGTVEPPFNISYLKVLPLFKILLALLFRSAAPKRNLKWSYQTGWCRVMLKRHSVWILARTQLSCLRFCGFSQSLQTDAEIIPWTDHDHFFPNPFQFIIHQSSYQLTLYSFNVALLKNSQKC